MGGSRCPGGVSVQGESLSRGPLSRGVSVQGGLCPGGLCLGGALSWRTPPPLQWKSRQWAL